MKMYVNWNQNSPPIVILTQCTAFYCRWRRWKLFVLCEKKKNGEILWLTFTRKWFSFKYPQWSSRRKKNLNMEKIHSGNSSVYNNQTISINLIHLDDFFIHKTITFSESKNEHSPNLLCIVTLFSTSFFFRSLFKKKDWKTTMVTK